MINMIASGKICNLLVNFGNRKVEYKRLHHPDHHAHHVACDHAYHV